MWAAQAFLLYGGEPTFSNQMQMMHGQRHYLNNSIDIEQRNTPQMIISTPLTNTGSSSISNRTLQNIPMQSPLQHTPQYPLSTYFTILNNL